MVLDAVARAAIIYVALIVCFRLSGRRTIGQATTFDLMLMLIISEAVSAALSNGDSSMERALVLVLTLVGLNVISSFLKIKSKAFDRLIDGTPIVLLRDGVPVERAIKRSRVDQEDILEAARMEQGIEDLADVRLATLERSGHISIVPRCETDRNRKTPPMPSSGTLAAP